MQSDILVRAWSILYLYCHPTLLGSLSSKWAKEEHVQLCVTADMLIDKHQCEIIEFLCSKKMTDLTEMLINADLYIKE